MISKNTFTAISPNSKVNSRLKKYFADTTRQVDDVQHNNYTQNTLNINRTIKSSKRHLLYFDDENNTTCENQLTHTISKYDYELTPNGNKQDEELLDINNLSFILAEDLCEDPSVVIPVVTPPLQLHSTENLALPLESLDNTDQPIIINNDKDVLNNSFVSAMLPITTDPEYNEPVTKVTGGRKRFKANQKKIKHNCLEERWSIECNHQNCCKRPNKNQFFENYPTKIVFI